MATATHRPTGVTILAFLALAQGMVGLVWPLILFVLARLASNYFDSAAVGWIGTVLAGLKLIAPLFNLVLAYGAFRLRPWAWMLGLLTVAFSLASGLGSYLLRGEGWWDLVRFTAIPGAILAYLFTPGVRRAFGRA